MRSLPIAILALVAIAGCRSGGIESAAGPTPEAAAPPPTADYLPVGTELRVELNQTLSTETSDRGDRFTATVRDPIIAQNGEIAVPRGAIVHGVVTGVDPSDRVGEQAAIRVEFESLEIDGDRQSLDAAVVEADVDVDLDDLDTVARDAGIGAAGGAALGAILGGDLSDILTGAVLGAGAGTVISLGTGEVEAALPSGSDLTLRTTSVVAMR